VHVDAAVPLLEVVADEERRPIRLVCPLEARYVGSGGLFTPARVVVGRRLGRVEGLVGEHVVVHRQDLERASGERYLLERKVPYALFLRGPDLPSPRRRRVVAPAQLTGGGQQVVLAEQTGRPAADEFLVVVEGQGLQVGPAGVGPPLLHERLRLLDLAAPLLRRPVGDAAGTGAEVTVEVGADLVPFEPGPADVLQRVLDVVVGQVADVRGAARVVRRVVQALLRLREQIQPREEEGHGRAVRLGEAQEAREPPVADLTGPVPGEDDELRRGLARLQRHRLVGLVGLLAGEGGGAVTDRPDGPARLGIRRAGTAAAGTAGPARAVRSREAAAAGQRDGGRGAGTEPEHSPAGEAAHGIPDRHA